MRISKLKSVVVLGGLLVSILPYVVSPALAEDAAPAPTESPSPSPSPTPTPTPTPSPSPSPTPTPSPSPSDSPSPTPTPSATVQDALTPVLVNRTPIYNPSGISYQVQNYDGNFTWNVTASAGTASIDGNGLVSVRGLTSSNSGGQQTTITVTATRSGYRDGSSSVTTTGPYNLSSAIQSKRLTAVLNGTSLTVNLESPGSWRWDAIWDGAVKIVNISAFPLVIPNYTSSKFQLYATDELRNYGYSAEIVLAPANPIAQPTLTISSVQSFNVGATTSVSTTGGAGSGAVSYTVSPSTVCTVSGTTITGVGAGDCTITATKQADSTYLVATATKVIQVAALIDNAPPVIGVISPISPKVVVENGTINISVALTDQTGVRSVTATVVRNNSSAQVSESGLSTGVFTLSRTAGTATNGTWSINAPVAITSGSSGLLISGNYDLVITAVDEKNLTSSSPTVSSAFTVGRQAASAVLGSGQYSSSVVIVGQTVTISTRAVSYGSEVSTVVATIGTVNIVANLTLASGTRTDGTWSAVVTIPLATRVGTYPISLVGTSVNGRTGSTVNLGNIKFTAPAPSAVFTLPIANATVSGLVDVIAQASVASGTSGRIQFVCLQRNGVAVQQGAVLAGSTPWYLNTSAGYGPTGNCYATSTAYVNSSGEFKWQLDPSSWPNGSTQFTFYAIDSSGSVSATATRSVNIFNGNPTASFTAPSSGSTQSGVFSVSGNSAVSSGSTAKIQYLCLKLDGSNVVGSPTGSWYRYTTNYTGIGNCWVTYANASSMPWGFQFDATGMTNGSHNLEVIAIDSTGKLSSWASLPFTVTIAQPTVSFTAPSSGSTQSGVFSVSGNSAVSSGSTAKIQYLCLKLDGSNVVGSPTGSWYRYTTNYTGIGNCWVTYANASSMPWGFQFDATGMTNGSHNLEVIAIDSTGKRSDWASLSFTVNNPLPKIQVVSPSAGAAVAGKMTVEIAIESALGDMAVGINDSNASPTGYFNSSSRSAAGVPANTRLWAIGTATSFSWTLNTISWPVGPRTLIVSVVDRANQVATAEVIVVVQSVKPTVMITSPALSQTVKGKHTISALLTSSAAAGRTLEKVGISESNATALFSSSAGYSSRMSSRYRVNNIDGDTSALSVSWTVDYSKVSPGNYTVTIAAEDSAGDVTEQSVQFIVAKAVPVIKIISPSANQTVNGALNLKVNAIGDPATTAKISYIAVNSNLFTPQFFGRTSSYCQLDSRYSCLNVDDLKDYSWTSNAGSWKDGNYSLTVVAIDDNGNSTSQTVSFTVSIVAPTVTITSPGSVIIEKAPFTLAASAIPNASSGAEIIAIAISEKSATPQFAGTYYSKLVTGLPSTAAIWQVANIKNPTWRIDASDWEEGDNVINVFAIDSNGKLGQSSITVHVAPEPTWRIDLQGAPVLGKSVPVLITMTTETQRRANPPVVVTLQSSSTSAGPWTDLGAITLDAAGTGAGRVLVTESLYVRVNHSTLDAVQPGVSSAKRIVNVPDPARAGGSNGTGAQNEDGSIPSVTCTAPPKAKSGAKVNITCVAQDVQDTSQPVTIFQQTGNGLKKLGSAKLRGTKITGSFTIKSTSRVSFIVKGAGDEYVPWSSNVFTVKFN